MTPKEYLFDYVARTSPEWKPKSVEEILQELGYDAEVEESREYRWWTEQDRILKLEDKYIGYTWATTHGDWSAFDKGFTFDESTVFFMEPYTVQMTKYKKTTLYQPK